MERDRRSIVGTFFSATPFAASESIALSEAAAHHARVKRLEVGDAIRFTDGAGTIGIAELSSIKKNAAEARVLEVERVPRDGPIHLRVPIGDRDRMLWLAEKSTELGITSWQSIRFRRSMSVSPRGEGPAFAEKIRGRMISALEQSGGAWLPMLLPDADVDTIAMPANSCGILLDAEGNPLLNEVNVGQVLDAREPVLLFGPEGGVEPDERDALLNAGWKPSRLARNTLRFETAGMAAISVLRSAQLHTRS